MSKKISFYFSDETFLTQNSLRSDQLVRLFVRVKGRIIPTRCQTRTTPTFIEIILVKEHPSSTRWERLEPSEYSEVYRPTSPLISNPNKGKFHEKKNTN